MRLPSFHLLAIVLICLLAMPASADVLEIQRLDFGTWYLGDNSVQREIIVAPNGSYSSTPGPIMVSPPQEGIYDIDGLTPNAVINSIDVTQAAPLERSGKTLDMVDFDAASSGAIDNNGEVTVNLGATARTTGDGTGYAEGLYTGSVDLYFDLNF